MAEYVLTADEVLYLAASSGADSFYGVRDGLAGLSEQDLKMKVLEMQDSLNQKGYRQTDFDGNSHMDDALIQMIGGCGDSDGMVCFEWEIPGEHQGGSLYFIKDKHIYEMTPREGIYVFKEIPQACLSDAIQKGIYWREVRSGEEPSFTIKQKELEKASRLAGRGAADQAKALLMEVGAGEYTADTIVAGMQHKIEFYSLLFVNNRMEEEPCQSVQFLQGKLLVAMQYNEQNNEDGVFFYVSNRKEQEALIVKGFEKLALPVLEEAENKMEFE